MDWQTQLIPLYLVVCNHWQEGGWVQAQRHAPYADLEFTDEEVVTIDLVAVALKQKRQIGAADKYPPPRCRGREASATTRIFTGMPGAIGGTGSPDCPATALTCSA